MTQSESTKKNTKWGMKILKDWHFETFETEIDMATISKDDLLRKLGQFSCEVKPQPQETDGQKAETKDQEYHKNTLKNIRGAVNRYLSDINRDIDIVNDREFKEPNKIFNGLLKERMTSGLSRPTKHKDVISEVDLKKIGTYLESADINPIKLRLCMWYIISIHLYQGG